MQPEQTDKRETDEGPEGRPVAQGEKNDREDDTESDNDSDKRLEEKSTQQVWSLSSFEFRWQLLMNDLK